ncbi:MAG: AAA family ATPase [Paludibacteraceae bacterium]|nr:AAA family ATPase [Paludibacteraceae bacterium]
MYIKNVNIKNFKCYDTIDFSLDQHMNVFIGVNGTGKSSILEALKILIGSLFLGFDKEKNKISSPNILTDDVRLSKLEEQYPVILSATGIFDEMEADISWERSLERKGGKTLSNNAADLKLVAENLQLAVRINEDAELPLVAYFSTERYKKEKINIGIEKEGSRFKGYFNALDNETNIKFFLNLYKTETLSELQRGKPSDVLESVNTAVKKCVDCKNLMYDVKKDELLLIQEDGEPIPFHLLSDGVRSTLALIMEIALRCHLLNPQLGISASKQTSGVVLIDEIDLHLHPEWQKKILEDLHSAFPCIQFIVTTHAPLVVGSIKEGRIFSVSNNEVFDFPLQYGRDANYILNEMGTDEMVSEIKELIDKYFILIEKGEGKTEKSLSIRKKLELLLGERHTELQRADMMLNFF